jgi:hypothetical protein
MSEVSKRMTVASDLEKNLIFQNLLKMKEAVILELGDQHRPGIVIRYENESVLLRMQNPLERELSGTVRAHFVFHNNYHYFEAHVRRIDVMQVAFPVPDKIYKNILRAHDRIDVSDRVFMRFSILVSSERKELSDSSRPEERILIEEVGKPEPAIDRMLEAIRRLVSDFSQNFQVKIFKGGERLSLDEYIIRQSGQIFLVYNSFEDSIEKGPRFEQGVMGVGDAFKHLLHHGETRQSAEAELLDLLQQKRDGHIFSESLVPLKLEGEVVGCIKLHNDTESGRSIKPAFVLRTSKYGAALVEALVKHDYFPLDSGDDFDVPVVNMSAGGLLFKLDTPSLKQYLILRTTLMMTIQCASRLIRANGMIRRINRPRSEFGVKFFVINDADSHFIDDVVHGRAVL